MCYISNILFTFTPAKQPNMKNKLTILLIFGAFAFGLQSCKKDVEEEPPVYKLGPNVYEIDAPTSQTLIKVDSSRIDFNGNTEQLQKLKVNDIIVSGIATNAPYGFLRRITAIQKNGNDYKFTTEEVSLDEAFEELHIDYKKAFSTDDTTGKKEGLDFTTEFDKTFDVDGNSSTEYDQIKITGTLTFTPDISVAIDISRFHLDYAKVEGSFTTEMETEITAGGSIASYSNEFPVYQQALSPLPIPGTPIVIVPFLRVNLGANGSINVEVTATNTTTATVSAYIAYENEAWSTGGNRELTNPPPVITGSIGSVTAKLYVEPGLDFKLYGSNLLKGSVIVQGYAKFAGSLVPLTCEIRAGISAGIEANAKLFSISLLDVSYDNIVDYSKVIWSCPTTPNCSGFSVSTSVSGTSITANPSGGTSPYTYSWSNGRTTQTISGLNNGTYTVTATDNEGCTASASGTVGGNPCQSNPVSVTTNVSGTSITANPSGGTSPYSYIWSNGETTKTISGLSNGTYTVTATDANGCSASASGTVGIDPCIANPLTISVAVSGDDITLSRSGTFPYDYNWSGPNGFTSTSRNPSNLDPGTYYVTVTDANGCTATDYGIVTGVTPTIITPSDFCTDPNIYKMQVNTAYRVSSLDISNIGFGSPIDGESAGGNDVRGFWLAFEVPSSFTGYLQHIRITNVSSNFDPVVGLKSNCAYSWYPNTNTTTQDFANADGNGGDEDFGTGIPYVSQPNPNNNDNIYYVRIYHYDGSETPTISFDIIIEE